MTAFTSESAREAAKKPRITPKARRFCDYYADTLWSDPLVAARKAAYKDPDRMAPLLVKKCSEVIAADKENLQLVEQMTAVECQALLARIGRGGRATMQTVRALELVARIHGLLGDTMTLRLDRKDIERELDARATQLLSSRKPLALPPPGEPS